MKNGFVHEVMSDGVHNSEIFICCLTDEYAKTENCMKELRLAGGLEKTILFVLFEEIKECSQSEVLKKFGLIDTYTNDQSYYYYKDIDNISTSIELILTHKVIMIGCEILLFRTNKIAVALSFKEKISPKHESIS
jgi:hypothetical protein